MWVDFSIETLRKYQAVADLYRQAQTIALAIQLATEAPATDTMGDSLSSLDAAQDAVPSP